MELEPTPPPSASAVTDAVVRIDTPIDVQGLELVRTDYRVASISHFINLFKFHVNFDFDITEFEKDLLSTAEVIPADHCLPVALGKLLNTLANDRNTNGTNWIPAMKRQFVRRGLYTPFQKHILAKIQPNHPDELKKTALREAEEAAAAAAIRAENGNVEEEAQMKMDVDAPVKDEEQPVAPVASTSLTKVEVVDPPPAASTSALPLVASTSNDITMNDDTNDVLATLGVQDAYESDGEDPDTTGMDVDDLKWDLKDVPWHRITLDVKIDAIYQICEWHMMDPERFRKYLKFENDVGWRLDPLGSDAQHNTYYHLADSRLWVHRAHPVSLTYLRHILPAPVKPSRRGGPRGGNAAGAAIAAAKKLKDAKGKKKERGAPKDRRQSGVGGVAGTPGRKKRDRDTEGDYKPTNNSTTTAPITNGDGGAEGEGEEVGEYKRLRGTRTRGSAVGASAVKDEGWEKVPDAWLVEQVSREEQRRLKKGMKEDDAYDENDEDEEDNDEDEEEDDEDDDERRGSAAPSSILSSLMDDEERDADEDEYDDVESVQSEVVEEVEEPVVVVEEKKVKTKPWKSEGRDKEGRMQWERDYWKERQEIDADEDFVEWEAICTTLEGWHAFVKRFAKTTNKDEKRLRDHIVQYIIPVVAQEFEEKEQARITDLAVQNRKRSTRIAVKESTADEDARISKEIQDSMSRTSRSSRHQKLGNLTESGLGLGAPGGIGGSSTEVHVGSVHESREERLKKREEDKELKKQAIELRAFNLAKRREREDATAANGGIVPEGMENEQEKEVRRAREEKERTKEAKEEVKRLKAVEKARLAAEKKAIKTGNQSYLPDEIYVPVEEEEPWYLDCEICKKEGWNLDDGAAVISCDHCNDWQHLDCHALPSTSATADGEEVRVPIDYTDLDFFCAKCRLDPTRIPDVREAPPPRIPAPYLPYPEEMNGSAVAEGSTPAQKEKRKYKPRALKVYLDDEGNPLPPGVKPTVVKQARKSSTKGTPKSTKTKTPKSSTSKARDTASNIDVITPSEQQQQQQTHSGMDYPALLDLVQSNPAIVNQLPLEYQQHFSTLLNIPIPYPE